MAQFQETAEANAFTLPPAVTPEGVAATELRPWGSFTILEEARGYKIKRIEVKPGHRLSLQMHHHRSEHWIVVSGTAKVTCGEEEITLRNNQSTYVPQCTAHRLENPGVIPLVLIEVQNGEYLGEDDIIRYQDDYARTEK
ncbi:MAG: phosphomannose isomerase type II C-terminal cupin domain [Rivularia sp. (in: cyanobacteria)]